MCSPLLSVQPAMRNQQTDIYRDRFFGYSIYSERNFREPVFNPAPGLRPTLESLFCFCPDFSGVSFDTARFGTVLRIGPAIGHAFGGC